MAQKIFVISIVGFAIEFPSGVVTEQITKTV